MHEISKSKGGDNHGIHNPEVVLLATAVSAVQGVKGGPPHDNPNTEIVKTTNAYEADE